MSLNGGYAMIKYNSTQEELEIAYKSKKPVLFYDENQRSHWAVIEETATESVDEETQEPITLYEYSYRLIDGVVANPTLSGDEATLNGLEVDGTKYKVGGGSEVHLYQHIVRLNFSYRSFGPVTYLSFTIVTNSSESITATYIRDELGINSKSNSLYISALDKDKYFTQNFYINADGKITINGIYLQDWSNIENINAYSQTVSDTVTQIF